MKIEVRIFILVFLIWVSLVSSSCSISELDEIEFIDDFDSVQKSILEFDSLLTYSNKECGANYLFGFSDLENGVEITDSRRSEQAVNVELSSVCPEAKAEVKRLREIAEFLKRNNIAYVYKKYSTGVNVFGYRYSSRTQKYSLRELLVANGNNKLIMLGEYELVDTKGKLMLFALKASN